MTPEKLRGVFKLITGISIETDCGLDESDVNKYGKLYEMACHLIGDDGKMISVDTVPASNAQVRVGNQVFQLGIELQPVLLPKDNPDVVKKFLAGNVPYWSHHVVHWFLLATVGDKYRKVLSLLELDGSRHWQTVKQAKGAAGELWEGRTASGNVCMCTLRQPRSVSRWDATNKETGRDVQITKIRRPKSYLTLADFGL